MDDDQGAFGQIRPVLADVRVRSLSGLDWERLVAAVGMAS